MSTEKKPETFRVERKGGNTVLTVTVTALNFIDSETNLHMSYVPSLNISAYGKDAKDAYEMLEAAIRTYITNLSKLPMKQIQAELALYNWRPQKIRTKIFRPSVSYKEIAKREKISRYTEATIEENVSMA